MVKMKITSKYSCLFNPNIRALRICEMLQKSCFSLAGVHCVTLLCYTFVLNFCSPLAGCTSLLHFCVSRWRGYSFVVLFCGTLMCYTFVFLAGGGALLWRPRNKVGHKSCAGEHFSQLALLLNKLVAGTWTEKKKGFLVDLFWNWQMMMCRLRIQKLKIRKLGDFEKIEFENFTL